MKTVIANVTIAASLMLAGDVFATEMPQLAKKNNCTACHAMDRKLVGPAWMDVAKKYKGDKEAEANLVAKIQKGGRGVWGSMSMPPQSAKEADIKELVKFILALAK